eukprot:jgi/Bigna1/146001/aug1.107_g20709
MGDENRESRHFFHVPKGWLKLDPTRVFVGGFSNGADFAHQFHVAYSGKISGACIVAGQPYRCATTYFGGSDPLVTKLGGNRFAVPYCNNCPYDRTNSSRYTLSYDHCKHRPDVIDVDKLVDYVRRGGDLDDPSNLRDPRQRVYIFKGTYDETYLPGSVAAVEEFYSQLMQDPNEQVLFEHSVVAGHGVVISREYNVVEECLKHVVFGRTKLTQSTGNNSASSGEDRSETRSGMRAPLDAIIDYSNLYSFNTRQFEKDDDRNAGFGLKAWIYAPKACQANAAAKVGLDENKGDMCPMFVWFNPCGGGWLNYNIIDFERWAETNNIVLLRPTVMPNNCKLRSSANGCGGSVTRACWDAYGHLGKDYAQRSGPHMRLANRVIQYVLDRRYTDAVGGN